MTLMMNRSSKQMIRLRVDSSIFQEQMFIFERNKYVVEGRRWKTVNIDQRS